MNKKDLVMTVINAPSACAEFKQAAQNWLDAEGSDKEKEAGKALVAEAEEDINKIDATIGFFSSDMAKGIFGEDVANEKLAHAKEIKENGALYCDCPGCSAAKGIIDNKELFI